MSKDFNLSIIPFKRKIAVTGKMIVPSLSPACNPFQRAPGNNLLNRQLKISRFLVCLMGS